MVNNRWYRNGGGRENHQGYKSYSYKCSAGRKTCNGRLCIWIDRNNVVMEKRITKLCSDIDHSLLIDNLEEVVVGREWSRIRVFTRTRRSPGKFLGSFLFFSLD